MNTFNPKVKMVSELYWLYRDHQPYCRKATMAEMVIEFGKLRDQYPNSYLNVVKQTNTTQDIMEHVGKVVDRIRETNDL